MLIGRLAAAGLEGTGRDTDTGTAGGEAKFSDGLEGGHGWPSKS